MKIFLNSYKQTKLLNVEQIIIKNKKNNSQDGYIIQQNLDNYGQAICNIKTQNKERLQNKNFQEKKSNKNKLYKELLNNCHIPNIKKNILDKHVNENIERQKNKNIKNSLSSDKISPPRSKKLNNDIKITHYTKNNENSFTTTNFINYNKTKRIEKPLENNDNSIALFSKNKYNNFNLFINHNKINIIKKNEKEKNLTTKKNIFNEEKLKINKINTFLLYQIIKNKNISKRSIKKKINHSYDIINVKNKIKNRKNNITQFHLNNCSDIEDDKGGIINFDNIKNLRDNFLIKYYHKKNQIKIIQKWWRQILNKNNFKFNTYKKLICINKTTKQNAIFTKVYKYKKVILEIIKIQKYFIKYLENKINKDPFKEKIVNRSNCFIKKYIKKSTKDKILHSKNNSGENYSKLSLFKSNPMKEDSKIINKSKIKSIILKDNEEEKEIKSNEIKKSENKCFGGDNFSKRSFFDQNDNSNSLNSFNCLNKQSGIASNDKKKENIFKDSLYHEEDKNNFSAAKLAIEKSTSKKKSIYFWEENSVDNLLIKTFKSTPNEQAPLCQTLIIKEKFIKSVPKKIYFKFLLIKNVFNKIQFLKIFMQKIQKNVNQFVYEQVTLKKFDKNIFYDTIKRQISVNQNKIKSYRVDNTEIYQLIEKNLKQCFNKKNKHKFFIPFINKDQENNLLDTEIYINDEFKLVKYIIFFIEHEKNETIGLNTIRSYLKENKKIVKNIFWVTRIIDKIIEEKINNNFNKNIQFYNMVSNTKNEYNVKKRLSISQNLKQRLSEKKFINNRCNNYEIDEYTNDF